MSTFDNQAHSDEELARKRFAHYTRSANFRLAAGIREIRMLANRSYKDCAVLSDAQIKTFYVLVRKGLVIHEEHKESRLSEFGKLTRAMMVLTGHIVEPDSSSTAPEEAPAGIEEDPDHDVEFDGVINTYE